MATTYPHPLARLKKPTTRTLPDADLTRYKLKATRLQKYEHHTQPPPPLSLSPFTREASEAANDVSSKSPSTLLDRCDANGLQAGIGAEQP